MELSPSFPSGEHGLHGPEFFSFHGAGYGCADQMAPEAVGLMIVHDQRVGMEFTRDAKGKLFSMNFTVIHDGRITERSPGDRDRHPTELVIDNLMAAQGGNRISASVAADLHADHEILRVEP